MVMMGVSVRALFELLGATINERMRKYGKEGALTTIKDRWVLSHKTVSGLRWVPKILGISSSQKV